MYASWIDDSTVTAMNTNTGALSYLVPAMDGEPSWWYMNSPRNSAVARVALSMGRLDGARTQRRGGARPALYR